MASITSLGIHSPSGLPYLVTEEIIDKTDCSLSWHMTGNEVGDMAGEEELVVTEYSVVWSQGGVVRRVFRFDGKRGDGEKSEKEKIRAAVLTWFPKHEGPKTAEDIITQGSTPKAFAAKTRNFGWPAQTRPCGSRSPNPQAARSRALVVFLKTQAHVYFLSGASHVLHMPFEVERALPSPRGLIIQRKLPPPAHVTLESSPVLPAVPLNSFISTQQQSWSIQSSQVTIPDDALGSPDLVVLPNLYNQVFSLSRADSASNLPSLYSLTDPESEMGLIVTTPSAYLGSFSGSQGLNSTASGKLNPAEVMVYISAPDEFELLSAEDCNSALSLAVTANFETRMYTVWSVTYIEPEPASAMAPVRTPVPSGTLSRRRSSYGPGAGTGATTPIGYAPTASRESFGGAIRGQAVTGSSSFNSAADIRTDKDMKAQEDQFASSLDPDNDRGGVPSKISRRVSSLVARADLSTNPDRLAFSGLATGGAANSGNVHNGSLRRGDSFGGYSTRGSLGGSFGPNRRGSVPGTGSFSSTGYHDTPVDDLLEELNAGGDFEGFRDMDLHKAQRGLKKEVVLTKIESFATEQVQSRDVTPIAGDTLKIFTLVPPRPSIPADGDGESIVMCIANTLDLKLLILSFQIRCRVGLSAPYPGKHRSSSATSTSNVGKRMVPSLADVERASGVIDAVKLTDGDIARILVLGRTEDGQGELTLRAPWSPVVRIALPKSLAIFNPYQLGHAPFPTRKREGGLKRVFSQGPQSLRRICQETPGGKVTVVDEEGKRHRLHIQMKPRSKLVGRILDVCRGVLPGNERGGEGVVVGWWQACHWLQQRGSNGVDEEWTAVIVVIWSMAVGFIDGNTSSTSGRQKRRKSGLLRSSGGESVDLGSCGVTFGGGSRHTRSSSGLTAGRGWNWDQDEEEKQLQTHPSAVKRGFVGLSRPDLSTRPALLKTHKKNNFLLSCIELASEFTRSQAGEAIAGPGGYLPTAMGKDPEIRRNALATVLVGLHLLREEMKLDVTTADSDVKALTPVLAQIGSWLGWETWSWKDTSYYGLEDIEMEYWTFSEGKIKGLNTPAQPFEPPSIYDWLWGCLGKRQQTHFMTLKDIVSPTTRLPGPLEGSPSSKSWWATLTPKTAILTELFSYMSSAQRSPIEIVRAMVECGVDGQMLDTFPEGIALPFREAIVCCQEFPPTTSDQRTLELLGRVDLKDLFSWNESRKEYSRLQTAVSHRAFRDIHSICNSTFDTESFGSFDGSAEMDRQAVTKLIFRDDQRFNEASRLLQTSKSAVAVCFPEPEWSESDLLDAQKELAQRVAYRTLTVSAGRGLLYFSARVPLVTEKFPAGGFILSCIMKPSNNTVSADKVAFTEEKVGWAFFHSGVASGLTISREAKSIDTSWIVFNRPTELNNRHAGFLLALGLNGHLKSVAKWVAFKYLTPKHTMTSIGFLLGLSASYLGTMDALVTRLLSVHVIRMLPPGAAELNLSPLAQTTGIMGIGLLYCNTQHRRMSEIMLSEIEYIDHEESSAPTDTLRDEGYRLAAGFALGFINLGRGRDLKGLHDMHLVERLLSIAVGSKKVSIVHVLDKSTAAATVAITLIFMKSQDEALARKIDVPDTIHQFDYVRPDIFLLRTLSKHLIMWNDIRGTYPWVKQGLPKAYRSRALLNDALSLSTEDLPFYNILTGLCLSIGLRFAGSGSTEVRGVLIWYLDKFMRLCRLPALNYDQKLTRSTVRNCQDVLALAAATVMAGTGDLHVLRRLRSLHGRTDPDTTYGSHLATHTAIGVLFLAGGTHTFGTSNLAVASLLLSFYPLFPNHVQDNKSHLQAFRHFWVLATEPRCLVPRDVETYRPCSIPISIILRTGDVLKKVAPCLLPELSEISSVCTTSPVHWPVVLDFSNREHGAVFDKSQTILVRRRAAHESTSSVFQATLQALDDTETNQSSLEWLLQLKSFAGLNKSERALVLPPDTGLPVHASMETTMVDMRLILEKACLAGDNADRLRNAKLLFAFVDQLGGQNPRFLTREIIDGLRAAVWMTFQG
ncbi:MAG: Anaphase-promoting complex subunit 1 [Geoglossum umbratile]|nr:MAG: Anaphase-promoting complex subunit 1 [Geoglossum umbratile]